MSLLSFDKKQNCMTVNNIISNNMGFNGNFTKIWDLINFSNNKYNILLPENNIFLNNIDKYLLYDALDVKNNNWSLHANINSIFQINKSCILCTFSKNDNFTNVINGLPRAELCNSEILFSNENTYKIEFKTLIPNNFIFEEQEDNRMIIFQLHQLSNFGSPALAITLNKTDYFLECNNGEIFTVNEKIKSAVEDIGIEKNWEIIYKPSFENNGIVNISINNQNLIDLSNIVNSWNEDSYIKIGLYKWNWQINPSSVNIINMFYSDLFVSNIG